VERVPPRQDLGALGPSLQRLDHARHPERRFVRIGPAGREQQMRELAVDRQEPDDALRQANCALRREVPEGRVVRDLSHLLGDCVRDLGATVPDIDVEEPGKPVDHATSIGELELDALPAHDDARPLELVLPKLGDRVNEVRLVELDESVEIDGVGAGHDVPPRRVQVRDCTPGRELEPTRPSA
jgi:hypothetical protein